MEEFNLSKISKLFMEEFNLSKKMEGWNTMQNAIDDVKEFIKRSKDMIEFEVQPLPIRISNRLNSQIDKLAGEELI